VGQLQSLGVGNTDITDWLGLHPDTHIVYIASTGFGTSMRYLGCKTLDEEDLSPWRLPELSGPDRAGQINALRAIAGASRHVGRDHFVIFRKFEYDGIKYALITTRSNDIKEPGYHRKFIVTKYMLKSELLNDKHIFMELAKQDVQAAFKNAKNVVEWKDMLKHSYEDVMACFMTYTSDTAKELKTVHIIHRAALMQVIPAEYISDLDALEAQCQVVARKHKAYESTKFNKMDVRYFEGYLELGFNVQYLNTLCTADGILASKGEVVEIDLVEANRHK
jgi:hypothetical protein